jgi:hypothetical protein
LNRIDAMALPPPPEDLDAIAATAAAPLVAILAAIEDGRWVPGIGDPTPMGWFTVLAYLVAAVLAAAWASPPGRGRALPIGLAIFLLLLAVNKQLDLQSWMTFEARGFLRQQGLYEKRRSLQVAFLATIAVGSIAVLALLAAIARRRLGECGVALAGVVLLSAFILVRAASFHRVDHGLGDTLLGLRFNWILELGGIAIFSAGAVIGRRRRLAVARGARSRSPWQHLADR